MTTPTGPLEDTRPGAGSAAGLRVVVGPALAALVLFALILATAVAVGAQDDTTTTEVPAPIQETTTTDPTTTTTTTTTTAPEGVPGVPGPTTTAPDGAPADPAGPSDDPPADTPGPDTTATTLPTGPPEGFTEEQFETFVSVVQACGPNPGAVCQRILAWTGNATLAEASQWIADVPLAVALVILLAFAANRLVRRGISRYLRRLDEKAAAKGDRDVDDVLTDERRALRMATVSSTLGSAASVLIFVVAVFMALAQFDISLGPLLAGAGIIGAALGFGAQNIVRDFLAGLFVTIEDQYGVGDIIDVGNASGVVEGITLRMTKIRDVEGTLWFVPNGEVKEVGNMTQRWARVILDVDVAYGADHHEAQRLIKAAADEMWLDPESPARLLEEPEMWGVEALGDSSVTIRIAIKSYPADQWKAARELRGRIKDAFDEAGIEIPFPQHTVWLRHDGPSASHRPGEPSGPEGSEGSEGSDGSNGSDGPA